RIPRSKPQRSGRRTRVAVAAAVLIPVIALLLVKFGGVTHLFPNLNIGRYVNPSHVAATSDTKRSGDNAQANSPPPAIAPFDATQAFAHQEAWAKHLDVPAEFTNSIGMKLRIIPPGKFTMGSSQQEIDFWLKQDVGRNKERLPSEGPQHEVEITQ